MARICAHELKNVPPMWVPDANWECRSCFRRNAAVANEGQRPYGPQRARTKQAQTLADEDLEEEDGESLQARET
jgi:hypothetical protein